MELSVDKVATSNSNFHASLSSRRFKSKRGYGNAVRASENAVFKKQLLLYAHIYIQSGPEDISISIKADTYQNSEALQNLDIKKRIVFYKKLLYKKAELDSLESSVMDF